MVTIHVEASVPYDVSIEQNDNWLDRVHYFSTCSKVWVITDKTVDAIHGKAFKQHIARLHPQIVWSVVTPGDGSKTLQTIEQLVTEGLTAYCDRSTLIVAFGGGMIGDLAGFLASVYMRGVRYIQVPTTVLAHDSAIGGKVAVNHPLAKNAIGSFYQPIGVHYNVSRLQTLTDRDVLSGLGELIKHAYLSRYVLASSFEDELFQALSFDTFDWETWLGRGIEVKRIVVEADEREHGVRAWLNFGHTFGHALESVERYQLSHGEAILYGMVYAFLVGGDTERARKLADWMKARQISPIDWQSFETYVTVMERDKKNQNGQVRFVLLGEAATIETIPLNQLSEAFVQLRGWF